jgi:hypothetical protein
VCRRETLWQCSYGKHFKSIRNPSIQPSSLVDGDFFLAFAFELFGPYFRLLISKCGQCIYVYIDCHLVFILYCIRLIKFPVLDALKLVKNIQMFRFTSYFFFFRKTSAFYPFPSIIRYCISQTYLFKTLICTNSVHSLKLKIEKFDLLLYSGSINRFVWCMKRISLLLLYSLHYTLLYTVNFRFHSMNV